MRRKAQTAASCREAGRRGRVSASIAAAGLDVLLVTGPANVRYLTGFTGSSGWLLLAPDRAVFITDRRYALQATDEVAGLQTEISTRGLPAATAEVLAANGWRRVGFEPEHLTVAAKARLEDLTDAEWRPFGGSVEAERRRKDACERDAIRTALAIAEAALVEVVSRLEPGESEVAIAADLETACRRRGAHAMAFETIVAAGARTSLPHGVASDQRVVAGEPLMIDMGCRWHGYCSDITRMVWCGGRPSDEWLRLYETVDAARRAALARIAAGVTSAEIDAAARRVVEEAGLAAGIRHGTGHGVGLEIHEEPALSERSEEIIEAGMVMTVEPGIYRDGQFGVRIEDMVLVTEAGCERLTTLDTEPMLRHIA